MQDLNQLQAYLRQFAKDRDWDQFHSPKNLSMALSELVENFQWLTEEQSHTLDQEQRAAVIDEIADVQMYLAPSRQAEYQHWRSHRAENRQK